MAALKTLALLSLFKNDRGPAPTDEESGGTTVDGGIDDDKEAEESVRTPRIAFSRTWQRKPHQNVQVTETICYDPGSNTVGSFGTAFTRTSTFSTFSGFKNPSWARKLKNFVFPPHDDDVDSYVPTYRLAPILSGVSAVICTLGLWLMMIAYS